MSAQATQSEVQPGEAGGLRARALAAGLDASVLEGYAPALDPRRFNPTGFRNADVAGFACLVTARSTPDAIGAGLQFAARSAPDEPIAIHTRPAVELPSVPPGARRAGLPTMPAGILKLVRPRLGVIRMASP